jgi:hypothetical protein
MTRRMCFALIITLLPVPVFARPKLGDEDWMRAFVISSKYLTGLSRH